MSENHRLMTRREVEEAVRMKTSNIYRLMSLNKFPKPIRVGTGAVRWIESEIQDFISEKIAARG